MKTKNKKLVGGLLIGIIVMAIGTVLVNAQKDDLQDEVTEEKTITFLDMGKHGPRPFRYNLTVEQQTELQDLMTALREQNATGEKIQTAITDKLDQYGVLDTQLDNEIAQTEQRLLIFNRQKELRDQGYTWNEINTIIQEEFNLENMTGVGFGIEHDYGFGHGPSCKSHEFMKDEQLNK